MSITPEEFEDIAGLYYGRLRALNSVIASGEKLGDPQVEKLKLVRNYLQTLDERGVTLQDDLAKDEDSLAAAFVMGGARAPPSVRSRSSSAASHSSQRTLPPLQTPPPMQSLRPPQTPTTPKPVEGQEGLTFVEDYFKPVPLPPRKPKPKGPGWEVMWIDNSWVQVKKGTFGDVANWDKEKQILSNLGYNIGRQLGHGAYSTVYHTVFADPNGKIHTLACKRMAVKSASAKDIAKLENEKKALMMCDHPNIVQIQNIINLHQQNPYYPATVVIFMPLADGDFVDLKEAKRVFNLQELKDYFVQIFSGMSYLHKIGIAHRDVKPNNVLYIAQGNQILLKITDFGLAHIFDPINRPRTDSRVGTTPYMAPEVYHNMDYYPTTADVFSTGVMLAEMCVHERKIRIFQNLQMNRTLPTSLICDEMIKMMEPGLDNQMIKNLIFNMMKEFPHQRITMAQALQYLQSLQIPSSSPQAASPTSPQPPPQQPPPLKPPSGTQAHRFHFSNP